MSKLACVRWLLCPVVLIVLLWLLLLQSNYMLEYTPPLWSVANVSSANAPVPSTARAAYDLGWQAALYADAGCEDAPAAPNSSRHMRAQHSGQHAKEHRCRELLEAAGRAVNATLTPAQLARMRALLQQMEAQRSAVDRVTGFFSFVNVVWAVSIVGLLATVGPCLAYAVGPTLLRLAAHVYELILVPLHRIGIFEVAAYAQRRRTRNLLIPRAQPADQKIDTSHLAAGTPSHSASLRSPAAIHRVTPPRRWSR